MLRNIRKSEERFEDKSHIVFLLQEPDLRYLVENIWGGQSVLSAVRDVFELTLARWEKEHWSPWNCLLLTKDEAKAHSKLEDIQQVRVGISTLCDGHVHSKPIVVAANDERA